MDRYVDPLVTHLKTMVNFRKFRRGSKGEVDEMLRVEKSEFPMRIVYCFGISYEHPGTFILTYIRSTNPHHEYVGLYPKGFKFRKRMFEDIDRLVAYFQRHIDEPQHDSAPSIRSVAAMVPMRSPANGGSSGNSWDGNSEGGGGWRGGRSYDRDRSSHPGSREGHRNSGGVRDDHPSGVPRPHGGRGRGGRGNRNENTSRDGGGEDGGSGWGSFPGAKVQNSPGREAFPGGWGTGGSGGASTTSTSDAGGWGAPPTKSSPAKAAAGGGWGGNGGGGGSW